MAMNVRCSSCNALLRLPDQARRTAIHCPKCQTEIVVGDSTPSAGDANEAATVYATKPEALPPRSSLPVPVPADDDVPEAVAAESTDQTRREGETPGARATNPAESFVWWQQQFKGRTFPYMCRSCGTVIPLRQRVTQSRRACPGCGQGISVKRIDEQIHEREPERLRRMKSGCVLLVLLVLASISTMAAIPIALFSI